MTKTVQEGQAKKTRKPTHPEVRCKAYKFRIYPTKKQLGTLEWTLRRCKELYNAALAERREAYLLCGVSISYRMQADQLPEIKRLREEYKVRNRRRDFLHQESRKLVKRSAVLVFEHLPIANMTARPEPKQDESGNCLPNGAAAKGGLNKSILDAGWGQFVTLCSHKAEEAGGAVVRVPPNDTSQQCSGCQRIVPKDLSVRWHSCPHCGTKLDRDHNAALNILRRYREKKDGAGSAPQISRVGYL